MHDLHNPAPHVRWFDPVTDATPVDRVPAPGRTRALRRTPARRFAALAMLALALALPPTASRAASDAGGVAWQPLTDATFATARAEGKLVFLELEAVWCHWCHVLDAQTWTDPAVRALMARHYIAVRVDSDARPDLATRYRAWGWPALVVLAPDGTEIVMRAGYVAPGPMARLLQAIVDDPSPEPDRAAPAPQVAAASHVIAADLRATLLQRDVDTFDPARGGLRTGQKFLDRDAVEWALLLAADGDRAAARRARLTLDAARALLDPVWGGVWQYSTGGDWQHPHYEKLARIQAAYLRIHALAWALWHDPQDRATAESIIGYMRAFLTHPDGGILTSQDADLVAGDHAADYFALGDAARRARGIPRIDPNRYAETTGLWVEALAMWADAAGDAEALAEARRHAAWAAAERQLAPGRWQHDPRDADGRFLADHLAMGRAWLALYRAGGQRADLDAARQTLAEIIARFATPGPGVLPVAGATGPLAVSPDLDDNVAFIRFAALLGHYTGDAAATAAAEAAMRIAATPARALQRITEPGVLIADRELGRAPLHLTIVGGKDDAATRALFEQARRLPGAARRLEWWDRREGPLPNPDVTYPELPWPAAFVCTDRVCSVPLRTPDAIAAFLAERLPVPAPGRG